MTDTSFQTTSILAIAGLETASEEEQVAFLRGVTAVVLFRLAGEIENLLAPEQRKEFQRLSSEEGSEKLDAFLEQHVPNIDELLYNLTDEVKAELGAASPEERKLLFDSSPNDL